VTTGANGLTWPTASSSAVVLRDLPSGLANAVFPAEVVTDRARERSDGDCYRPEDGEDEENTRRASTRAAISRSTRSRNDSTTASLYSGPSSLCASAAARTSCGENGDELMGETPPAWSRPSP
jgi:hypothetical protein